MIRTIEGNPSCTLKKREIARKMKEKCFLSESHVMLSSETCEEHVVDRLRNNGDTDVFYIYLASFFLSLPRPLNSPVSLARAHTRHTERAKFPLESTEREIEGAEEGAGRERDGG